MSNGTKIISLIALFAFAYFVGGMFLLHSFEKSPIIGGLLALALSSVAFWMVGVFGPRVVNKLGGIW